MDFFVGSFNQKEIFTLTFTPPATSGESGASGKNHLSLARRSPAVSGHSWIALSKDKNFLYATCWGQTQPAVAAYRVRHSTRDVEFINSQPIQNLSGYVCVSSKHLFSAGGATGEVFRLEPDGSIGPEVQRLDFINRKPSSGHGEAEANPDVPHGDFGGVRFGAHSIDLSPDGKALYVADIGRNCVWTFAVDEDIKGDDDKDPGSSPVLRLASKQISPRTNDGPRHTWPHPGGKILYSLEEHSSMVDVYAVADDGVTLEVKQACAILPPGKSCDQYWADEVRVSTGPDPSRPRYLYASTRGLEAQTKGYVSVFELSPDGTLADESPLAIWETPTSGGIANAIEPAPYREEFGGAEYLALTDSLEGLVLILKFDGKAVEEVGRVELGQADDGKVVGAATPIWL